VTKEGLNRDTNLRHNLGKAKLGRTAEKRQGSPEFNVSLKRGTSKRPWKKSRDLKKGKGKGMKEDKTHINQTHELFRKIFPLNGPPLVAGRTGERQKNGLKEKNVEKTTTLEPCVKDRTGKSSCM